MQAGFASFRDPGGSVVSAGGRVFRLTTPEAAATLAAALGTSAAQGMVAGGRLVRTTAVAAGEIESLIDAGGREVFEHEPIAFPSYPYEWPAEMLAAAGGLTLELARALLADGFSLKDASPYNVLFRGPEPVFVDVLSLERRDPHDPIWLPYAQFIRTFLVPLALNARLGLPLDQMLLTRRDGVEPEEVYRWLPLWRRMRPPFLALVTLPVWLAKEAAEPRAYRRRSMANPEKARFVLESLLKRLKRTLGRLEPRGDRVSAWSGYEEGNSYTPAAAAQKAAFVERVLREYRPRRVLDVGANTGRFSELAAGAGASVVAIDRDPVVVGALWRRARAKGLDILPLVVDISRPTPAAGWRNAECAPFLGRCEGFFDAVWMLALLHHLVVSERVPLEEVMGLGAQLTKDILVIEFVGPGDAMFERLLRGRGALYGGYSEAGFRCAAERWFEVVASERIAGLDRTMYLLRKR